MLSTSFFKKILLLVASTIPAGLMAGNFNAAANLAFNRAFTQKIKAVNADVLAQRRRILGYQQQLQRKQKLSAAAYAYLFKMGEQYKVRECTPDYWTQSACFAGLVKRVDGLPTQLVLAQAIIESDWGRSRFAREGNNYFGIWCYRKGCGLVPKGRDANDSFEVQKFANATQSIERYYHLINTHMVYRDLRDVRANMRAKGEALNAYTLAASLEGYSARKQAYVKAIQSIIKRLGAYKAS